MLFPIAIPFTDILGNDDGIGMTITGFEDPTYGSISVDYEYSSVTYTAPTTITYPEDSFGYTVTDAAGQTASASIFIKLPVPSEPQQPEFADRWRIKINAATGPRAEIISPTPPSTCSIQFANIYRTNYTDGNSGTSADTTGSTENTSGFTPDLYIEAPSGNVYKGFIFTGPAPWYVQYNFSAEFQPLTSSIASAKSLDGSNTYTEKGVELLRAPRQFDLQHYDASTDDWKTVWISPESTTASGYLLNSEHNTIWPNRINDEDFLTNSSRHYLIKITSGNAQDYAPQLYDLATNQPVSTIDHEYYDGGYQDMRTVELQGIDLRVVSGIPGNLSGGAVGYCTAAENGADPLAVFEGAPGFTGYQFRKIRDPDDDLKNGFPYYLEYIFPTPVLIDEIVLTATNNPDRMPRRFEVQKKDEATGWYETVYVQTTSTTNWSAGETRAFKFNSVREPANLASRHAMARMAEAKAAPVTPPTMLASLSMQTSTPVPVDAEDRGDPDSYVTYCYSEGEEWWSIGKLGRTAGIPVLVNHDPILAGSDGSLYRHEVTGQTAFTSPGVGRIYATSGALTPGPDGSVVTVNGVIPDDESGYQATTWHFKTKINSNDEEVIKGPYNSRPDGIIDTRFTARQVEIQVEQAKDGRWTFGEPEFDFKQRGLRR